MVKVREARDRSPEVEEAHAARAEVDHVRFAVHRSESGLYRHEARKYVFEMRAGKSIFER